MQSSDPIVDGPEEGEYLVPSESIEGKFYTVKVTGEDALICGCPGYISHKKCKHVNRVTIEKIL